MQNHKIKHFLINLLCGIIIGEHNRRKIRVILNTRILSILKFIKQDCQIRHPKIQILTGRRGKNLVICVNKRYVYKFKVAIDDFNDSLEQREYDITYELSKISPIPISVPKIIKYKHGIARKYDFINGISLHKITSIGKYEQAKDILAKQLAYFIYKVAQYDRQELYKYKDKPEQKPEYMYGWYHNDIYENFLINPDTFKINTIIDWEDAKFTQFNLDRKIPNNQNLENFMHIVKKEYDRHFYKN